MLLKMFGVERRKHLELMQLFTVYIPLFMGDMARIWRKIRELAMFFGKFSPCIGFSL